MPAPALFHDHRHDRVFIRPPALLMHTYDLVDADIAHQVAHDEHKVRCHQPTRVDVPHSISRRKRLLRRHDGHNFHSRAWFRPFRFPSNRKLVQSRQ